MSFDTELWKCPPARNRVNPMIHQFPRENRTVLMDAIRDFGFGGAVINPEPDIRENGARFSDTIRELEKRGLSFWIYDEKGYPSGFAGGETLKGHEELEAKGFYMYRVAAYKDRHFTYHIDDDSDRIVWAASYPLDTPGLHQSYVMWDRMEPVNFENRSLEWDMKANTVLYIFSVRPAYLGSQATHNTCSFEKYINILEPEAVKRFIDVAYAPVAEACPEAYAKADAVFTDEPSLMTTYVRDYETWNFALAPWFEGLFEAYENEYGESLLPQLPLLFEGTSEGYPVRVRFYRLIGKQIARSYSGQLREWCAGHSCTFSGHYLAEEEMNFHVRAYGSYVEVLRNAGYPGLDVLNCVPESFLYNTVKHPQIAMRKMGASGMMVEICPFGNLQEFNKAPLENMTGVMGILYMNGVRVTNSYFSSNFEEYDPERLKGYRGYMHRQEAIDFNRYIGRMGYMLDGLSNDTDTFVYYGIEDAAAKLVPRCTGNSGPECEADCSAIPLTRKLIEEGHDFYYADRDDLVEAASGDGTPEISGHRVRTFIVPALDVLHEESYCALEKLSERGVRVLFLDKIPFFDTVHRKGWRDTKDPESLRCVSGEGLRERASFSPVSIEQILELLRETDEELTVEAGDAVILKARFRKDGRPLWMIDNNTRTDREVLFRHKTADCATLYDPVTGDIRELAMGEKTTLRSFRSVFLWLNR